MGRMNVLRTWLIAVVAAAGLWLAAAPGYAQVNIQLGIGNAQITLGGGLRGGLGQCLNDRQIARAIANGEIRTWPEIRQLAGIPASYHETSDVKVCMRAGVPFYIVNMVSPKGENVKYVLNALDGSG
jgi:hypothetical protein